MIDSNEFSSASSANPASSETSPHLIVEEYPCSAQIEITNETFVSRVSLGLDSPLELQAFRKLAGSPWRPGEIAAFVFQESVVVETVRSLVGSDITDLPGALWFAREGCLSYDVVRVGEPGTDLRYIVFYANPTSTQAVVFHAMWTIEARWQQVPTMFPFDAGEALRVRTLVHATIARFSLPSLCEQEAITQLLPCGPYQTFRGPVVVRWNNTCCREICPFCANEDKPSWGFWAFLYGLGCPVLCLDCWCRGRLVAPSSEEECVPAERGHTHRFLPDDVQGLSGSCICGAYWTSTDGWWREDAKGVWHRERLAADAGASTSGVDDRR